MNSRVLQSVFMLLTIASFEGTFAADYASNDEMSDDDLVIGAPHAGAGAAMEEDIAPTNWHELIKNGRGHEIEGYPCYARNEAGITVAIASASGIRNCTNLVQKSVVNVTEGLGDNINHVSYSLEALLENVAKGRDVPAVDIISGAVQGDPGILAEAIGRLRAEGSLKDYSYFLKVLNHVVKQAADRAARRRDWGGNDRIMITDEVQNTLRELLPDLDPVYGELRAFLAL